MQQTTPKTATKHFPTYAVQAAVLRISACTNIVVGGMLRFVLWKVAEVNVLHAYSLFQFGSHTLDSHNIHTIKSENLD